MDTVEEQEIGTDVETGGTDEMGFLDSIDQKMGDFSFSDDDLPEDAEEPAGDAEEPAGDAEEPAGDAEEPAVEDLASEFPTAESLKDILEDDRAVAKWGELRGELETARKQVRELESKLDGTQSSSDAKGLEAQLAEARALIQDYERDLSVVRVERSPEYRQYVAEPLQEIMNRAEEIAESYEKSVEQLFDIMADPSNPKRQAQRLEEFVEGISEADRFSLYRMIQDSALIFKKDAELKNKAAEAAVEIEARRDEEEKSRAAEEALKIRAGVEKTFELLDGRVPDLGKGADLKSLRERALSSDFSSLDAGGKAYAVAAGTLVVPMVKAIRERDSKIADLTKQLQAFQKASPRVDGAGVKGTPSGGAKVDDSDGLGFFEAIDQRLSQEGI